jgi:hypothetical protein
MLLIGFMRIAENCFITCWERTETVSMIRGVGDESYDQQKNLAYPLYGNLVFFVVPVLTEICHGTAFRDNERSWGLSC